MDCLYASLISSADQKERRKSHYDYHVSVFQVLLSLKFNEKTFRHYLFCFIFIMSSLNSVHTQGSISWSIDFGDSSPKKKLIRKRKKKKKRSSKKSKSKSKEVVVLDETLNE